MEPIIWSKTKKIRFEITEADLYRLAEENEDCVDCFLHELNKYEVEDNEHDIPSGIGNSRGTL